MLGLGGAPPKSLSCSIGELMSSKDRVIGRGLVPDGGETGKDSEPFEFSFGAISWDKALNGAGDEYGVPWSEYVAW